MGVAGTGVGAVLLVLTLSWWAARPAWVPVATNVPLESVSETTDRLDKAKLAYRLQGNGQEVLVASTDLAKARVALAEGGLPLVGRPGMELFDQPSWTMTDFTQRVNYRRAQEGELERTIGKMRGVESAQVHLAIEESQSFRRQQGRGEASVVLRLQGGERPDADIVQGVQHLVASSVGGISSENVMVLDDAGRLLSTSNEPGSLTALAHRRLGMQREVEERLEQKAVALLGQVVGPDNARVQVSAEINSNLVEPTTAALGPDAQVTSARQISGTIPSPEGRPDSGTDPVSHDNSPRLETLSSSAGGVRRLTIAVLVNDREVSPGSYQPRAPTEIQQIQTLVEHAVGFNASRGDEIAVVSMAFTTSDAAPAVSGNAGEWIHELRKPILILIVLLMVFFIVLKLIRTLRPQAHTGAAVASIGGVAAGALAMSPVAPPLVVAPAVVEPPAPSPPVSSRPAPRAKLEEVVEERPDVAARLSRSWLQESNG